MCLSGLSGCHLKGIRPEYFASQNSELICELEEGKSFCEIEEGKPLKFCEKERVNQ